MLLRGSGQAGSEGASLNYYERHIGDYLKDTSHLSLLEHGIYTRLLDVYYTREGAIPEEQAARLIGARTKDEREALQAVLSEFFELTADGWAQQRCEREIARFKDGEPEREAKKANEDNRLKRHREERARLFKMLTDVGQHAPWNIGMNELRELVKRITATAPETPMQPLPATAPATPATANQTPDTSNQTPKKRAERGSRLSADWTLPEEWAEWCRTARPDLDPDKVAAKFADYWHGVSGKSGVKLDWLATWRNWVREERAQFKAQAADVSEWYETRRGVEKKAASLGMGPWVESEEQYPAYKARVMEKAKVQSKSFGLNLDQLAAMAAQKSSEGRIQVPATNHAN